MLAYLYRELNEKFAQLNTIYDDDADAMIVEKLSASNSPKINLAACEVNNINGLKKSKVYCVQTKFGVTEDSFWLRMTAAADIVTKSDAYVVSIDMPLIFELYISGQLGMIFDVTVYKFVNKNSH